jgi:uncharacterized protein with PIN domain
MIDEPKIEFIQSAQVINAGIEIISKISEFFYICRKCNKKISSYQKEDIKMVEVKKNNYEFECGECHGK